MSKTIRTVAGEFDFHKAQKLRRRYHTALEKKEESFVCQRRFFVTPFAGYLVEYLESQFPLASEDEPAEVTTA